MMNLFTPKECAANYAAAGRRERQPMACSS